MSSFHLTQEWPCRFKLLLRVKARLHLAQIYGFSPEWTDWCAVRLYLLLNAFIHVPHLYDFSPLCVLQ